MASMLGSPLSGNVNSGRSKRGIGKTKRNIVFGVAAVSVIPFLLSTFAASVTIGTGALEFGQGSQQAIACDQNVYVAIGEEWHGAPTQQDSSAGFFRVRTVTISNVNVESCSNKRLRVRLIDGSSLRIIADS